MSIFGLRAFIQSKKNTMQLNAIKNKLSDILALDSMIVTPEQYGAKGDGISDDTVAIQAAIDYASGYTDINLVDEVSSSVGYLLSDGSVVSDDGSVGGWVVYDKIPVESNRIYKLQNVSYSETAYIVLYDSTGAVVRSIPQTQTEHYIEINTGETHIRFGTENTSPILYMDDGKGRILFLDRKTYRVTDRLIANKPVIIQGASTTDTILFFDGVEPQPEIKYDPINYEESHAVLTLKKDNCTLSNFTITTKAQSSEQACDWNGLIFHTTNEDCTCYYGSGRHTIEQVYINGFKNGIFIYAGWNRIISNCNFVNCKVAGIGYKALELGTVGNWSASGDIIQSCQMIGNKIGLSMDKTFETSAQNCIFEYNENPIYTFGCSHCFFINCWNEANVGNILINGNAKFQGGYNITKNTITHNGNGIVMIDNGDEVVGLQGDEVVFFQQQGIITKGVSIGSKLINMLRNPTFGTIAESILEPWTISNSVHLSIDRTMTLNNANSMLVDCEGATWGYDVNYGFQSEVVEVEVGKEYTMRYFVRTNDKDGIDMGTYALITIYNDNGEAIQYLDDGDVTPIANDVWEEHSLTFVATGSKVKLSFGLVCAGKVWFSNIILSLSSVTSDNISFLATENPDVFNVVDWTGQSRKQLYSSDYVEANYVKNTLTDSVTNIDYTWSLEVNDGVASIKLSEVTNG